METRSAARPRPSALDRRELAGLLVAALVAGTGVALLAIAAPHWTQALLRCGSGLSGLGCAIVGGAIQLAGLLVAGVGLDMLVLGVFRVRRWFPIGLFVTLTVGLGWGVIQQFGGSRPAVFVALIAAYAAGNVLYHAVFNLLPLPLGATLAIAVGFMVVVYLAVPHAETTINSVQRDRATSGLPFAVYLPRSLAPR